MPSRARRRLFAPRIDLLEARQLLSTTAASFLSTQDPNSANGILVRFKVGVAAPVEKAILQSVQGQLLSTYPNGPSLVELPSQSAVAPAIARLSGMPSVRYAEADGTITVEAASTSTAVPNDPDFSQQWGLSNPTGSGADIDAEKAWSVTTGNPSTIIAVIDSGIDLTHPEFAGRIWTNPNANSPTDATPGDVNGWNFINNTPDVQDDNGHGSHVSGIIAANANNGEGVVGVNWQAQIMPLKFIDQFGNGSVDDAVRAIYYAVDHGASVINASWGGSQNDQALTDAISYAGSHNVVFVTAAGNEGVNNAVVKSYPTDDRLSNVISVAAVDENGKLATFSNFGSTTVDLGAPGVNIVSTVVGGYATYSGTSMATPYVTGVVSLLQGEHPNYTASQIVQRIDSTTKSLSSLTNKTISGGIVDAFNAVSDQYSATPAKSTSRKTVKLRVVKKVIVRKLKIKTESVGRDAAKAPTVEVTHEASETVES